MSRTCFELMRDEDLSNLRFGLLEPTWKSRYTAFGGPYEFKRIDHYQGLEPAQTQKFSSCESEASANFIEWAIWYYCQERVTIDPLPFYRYARKKWHDGTLNGGLFLGQSFQAMKEMGCLPPDAEVLKVYRNVAAYIDALEFGPFVVGNSVDEGWNPENVNPENGMLDERFPPIKGNGHATLLCGSNTHNGVQLFNHMNSWGPEYGINGIFGMTIAREIATSLDDGAQIRFHTTLDKWDGFREFIVS